MMTRIGKIEGKLRLGNAFAGQRADRISAPTRSAGESRRRIGFARSRRPSTVPCKIALLACLPFAAISAFAAPAAPQIGRWGFDLGGMDRSVRPGDNFFVYANGAW